MKEKGRVTDRVRKMISQDRLDQARYEGYIEGFVDGNASNKDIHVGDEVVYDGKRGVVIQAFRDAENDWFNVLMESGDMKRNVLFGACEKTGRTYEGTGIVVELMDKLRRRA